MTEVILGWELRQYGYNGRVERRYIEADVNKTRLVLNRGRTDSMLLQGSQVKKLYEALKEKFEKKNGT